MSGLMTFKEAYAYLGVGDRTLRKMVADKEIRYIQYRANGPIKFRREHLDAWIDSKTVPTAAERAKSIVLPGGATLRRRRVV